MLSGSQSIIYLLIFCSGFLAVQLMAGMGRQASTRLKLANTRMKMIDSEATQASAYAKMRRSRGIDDENQLNILKYWLGRLVLHSGLPLGNYGIYVLMVGLSLSFAAIFGVLKHSPIWAIGGFALGIILPIMVLRFLAKRRRNKAVTQLPEALDVIIRSLAAGHPVPVAIGLVASEMPDPIGSEFGMASDEISFGSSISAALQRLADRVGHEDFDLFVAMIRLQERTGGNLVELLTSNAKTIRDRQRMRLKIKAASAEGRMSALILNVAPLLLFVGIKQFAPGFYGDVEGNPVLTYTLWGVVIWMIIGNLVMRKMINFKI